VEELRNAAAFYVHNRFEQTGEVSIGQQRLIAEGLSPSERRRVVDKVAAALILQDYLDSRGEASA